MKRSFGLLAVLAAFASAALAPCPGAAAPGARGMHAVISAPCPCHCGEHRASSPASHLDPVVGSAGPSVAERGSAPHAPAPLIEPPAVAHALPDPVPISA